jgi:mannose-6-phosphate isomerase-like protein (cupin superfamily)
LKTSKNNAQHYTWGDGCDGWILLGQDKLSVIHERMPPGTSEVRHFHRVARQFFFVLRGNLTIEVNGRLIELSGEEGLEVAPGMVHQVMNRSDRDVEFLVISHPNTKGDRMPAVG